MRCVQTLVVLGFTGAAFGQTPYSLLPASVLEREACLPPCACPPTRTIGPLRGTFTLALLDSNPLFTRYSLNGIFWRSDGPPGSYTSMGGAGVYTIGGEVAPVHRLELSLTIGQLTVITDFDSGFVPVDPGHPFPQLSIGTIAEPVCRRDQIRILAVPNDCYANCDGSTLPPVLNANDFQCFMNAFAAGNMWADCDGSHLQMLTANDFQCFLNMFAAGCS